MGKKVIGIGVPCYNEEKAFPLFLHTFDEDPSVRALKERYDFLLIFADDGSKDATRSLLQEEAERRSDLFFVSFDRNYGKEAALLAIYQTAIALKVDALIKMDVDLQDPPSLLPKFVEAWEKGIPYVYGHCEGRKGQKLLKKVFSKAFYRLYRWISLEGSMKDGDRDYALLDESILPEYASIVTPHRFDRSIFGHLRLQTARVDYPFSDRPDGTTRWSFHKLAAYSFNAFRQFGALTLFALRICAELSFVAFLVLLNLSLRDGEVSLPLFGASFACLFASFLFLGATLFLWTRIDGMLRRRYRDYIPFRIEKTNVPGLQTESGERQNGSEAYKLFSGGKRK